MIKQTYKTAAAGQQGYILFLVLVLLIALMVGAMSFFRRANDITQLSGASRDYDLAMVQAESGGNWVLGRFTNIKDTAAFVGIGCAAASMPGDLNCDGTLDTVQGRPSSFTPALPLTLGYQFYQIDTAGVTAISNNNAPRIVQMVADGEARNSGGNLGGVQTVLTTTTRLRVNDLFVSASVRPILLVKDANGLMRRSNNDWDTEIAAEKMAIWVEITRNPDPNKTGYFDLYLSVASKVGNSKAYLQRYLGSYGNTLGGIVVAPISEAALHG